jgi:hypothetical protein
VGEECKRPGILTVFGVRRANHQFVKIDMPLEQDLLALYLYSALSVFEPHFPRKYSSHSNGLRRTRRGLPVAKQNFTDKKWICRVHYVKSLPPFCRFSARYFA